jgi:hypothetical protein
MDICREACQYTIEDPWSLGHTPDEHIANVFEAMNSIIHTVITHVPPEFSLQGTGTIPHTSQVLISRELFS